MKRLMKLIIRNLWGIAGIFLSWFSFVCDSRYGAIHWHGPQRDMLASILGENMFFYKTTAQYMSLVAVALAITHLAFARSKSRILPLLIHLIPLELALAATLIAWFSAT